jgi:glycosyltransferase involved in cell wall biosynthesis
MTEMDRRCCCYADLVIASSGELYELCKAKNQNTFLVGHGVNYSHFAKGLAMRDTRPSDLPHGPVVGFFGLLSEWVDQELIVKLALALRTLHPDTPASIVLIGTADVAIDRLKAERNIHILGPRSFAALPEYVAWFDVAIIPFVVNDLTRAVNPIKLKEMLAAGCPVVSTTLPEVARYAEGGIQTCGVTIGRDHEEFVRMVKERLEHPLGLDARCIVSRTMAGETWEAKTREILSLIR